MRRIGVLSNTKLYAVLVLAALVWSFEVPHCVEAGRPSSARDTSVATTGCCDGSTSEEADCDAACLCPCPCFQVLGYNGTLQVQFRGVSSAVTLRVAKAPPSAVKTPPSPVPILG